MSPATLRSSHVVPSRCGGLRRVDRRSGQSLHSSPTTTHGRARRRMPISRGTDGRPARQPAVPRMLAAQQTAEGFVTACDTTDPAHPDGRHGHRSRSRSGAGAYRTTWCGRPPGATEDRRTTVVLDPPGQPVAERGDTVAVIVTGMMTVTSDSGPPQLVPVAERIALHALHDDRSAGDRGVSGWRVVDVEVGA